MHSDMHQFKVEFPEFVMRHVNKSEFVLLASGKSMIDGLDVDVGEHRSGLRVSRQRILLYI